VCRRFSIARSNPQLNAEGYGIQQEIRGEAKEIQHELTDVIKTDELVIWLRWWKKLISRMLGRGGECRRRDFCHEKSRACQAEPRPKFERTVR
jgi:hypothetical protein